MTLDQKLDQELIDFMCERFDQCDCLEALETCLAPLQSDINSNASYTLVPGALDRIRGVYRRRLSELKGK
jgi:hypothetical protein